MENNEEKNKIEELKKHLNSRSFSSVSDRDRMKRPIKDVDGINRDWSHLDKEESNPKPVTHSIGYQMAKKKSNFLKLFLTISIIFFIIALSAAAFILFGGRNIISSDNVEISVSGPVSISGGETLSLDIIIQNNNNTELALADLIIEYPEGTRSPQNLSVELPRERFSLGNISSGKKTNKEINAILFGEEGSKGEIKLTVEYRVAGSNAIFFKETIYEIEISSSPVSFSVESLKEINSGKEINLDLLIKSNSNNLIENLMFISEYPFGFTFKNSSPRPSYEQNIWKIGDLSPGEERKIRITGTLEGQDGENRVFRFFSGIQSENEEKELQTAFISSTHLISINKPFLAVDMVIDGNTSGNYNTFLGETVSVDLLWKNNLPISVANVEVEALLSGDIDETSVFVENGFYDSVQNTISWSQEQNPVFESISPGQRGTVRFSFKSVNFEGGSLSNPEAAINVSVRGRRLSETSVSEEVVSSAQREIRFNTNLSLVPRVVHFSGPISNIGPIPPKAETETTYTVIWALSNNVNNVSDSKVSARLPSYVRWTGQTVPNGEKISYNSVSKEVTWEVGNVDSGTGFSSPLREAIFQIALIPSLSQLNQVPILVEKIRIVGNDNYTGVILDNTKRELTTRFSTDSSYKTGDERVAE